MALICKWIQPSCGLTFGTAEVSSSHSFSLENHMTASNLVAQTQGLFNHLCDVHVGRKRHGNLSLNCS
ncbi:uncharacterized protein MELLADRAFT_90571 [Melampsora larici-populina 98AG31]|uniref:Uncharacterized protein n=1 Tax=Melampsora larici-populina (strain 98AG31 / pathotype 3-4-7) TaxID=747676 RepID=F4RXE2_MELLP|nr:uncharacterized protein MELLADRAFT_90571 [Melampsora larici-populina 98AG31]EGG02950.1 hypothetical protein MELLADRAFT_90571 [Melampsora larici-populina 98AG31]